MQVRSLGWEDPLEEGMATHSSVLAWRIPWTEEPGRLQSMRLLSVHVVGSATGPGPGSVPSGTLTFVSLSFVVL